MRPFSRSMFIVHVAVPVHAQAALRCPTRQTGLHHAAVYSKKIVTDLDHGYVLTVNLLLVVVVVSRCCKDEVKEGDGVLPLYLLTIASSFVPWGYDHDDCVRKMENCILKDCIEGPNQFYPELSPLHKFRDRDNFSARHFVTVCFFSPLYSHFRFTDRTVDHVELLRYGCTSTSRSKYYLRYCNNDNACNLFQFVFKSLTVTVTPTCKLFAVTLI